MGKGEKVGPSVPAKSAQVEASDSGHGHNTDNEGIAGGIGKEPGPGWVERRLRRLRRTPAGRLGVRITIGGLGALVIGLGLILVPLPGPGWLIVFGGLAIWSLEFEWAKRLNRYTRRKVSQWTTWYGQQGWPLRILVGFGTLIVIIAVLGAATYTSLGPDPFRWVWNQVT
jgi:uncharacterized protein (TIGR02611 family)